MTISSVGKIALVGLVPLFGLASTAHAQPAETRPAAAKTDLYGDPLPPGAIARMGTARWRLDVGGAACLAMAADGKTLVAVNRQTGVSIWDLSTGRIVRQQPGKEETRKAWLGWQTAVALSADGKVAAFGTADGIVHLLDVDADKEGRQCRGHRGPIQEAVLSRDGGVLVTRSEDKTLRVWAAKGGKQLHELALDAKQPSQYQPWEIAVSPDGKTFAWIGNDKERVIHVCDTAIGAERQRLGQHEGDYRQMVFAPDGRSLVSTSWNGRIQLWDVKTGQLTRDWTSGGTWGLPAAAFAPDGKTLIVSRGGDALRLLEVATGKELWKIKQEFASTTKDAFAFTPDGKTLLAAQFGGPILDRYDTATGKSLRKPEEMTTWFQHLAFSADEKTLHTIGWDRVWRTWETATGKELHHVALDSPQAAFAPDGGLLAAVKDGVMILYDTATKKELRCLPGAPRSIGTLLFAPDSRTLLVQGEPSELALWDATTGKELRRLPAADLPFNAFDFAADGKTLVGFGHRAGDLSCYVQVWDVATGRPRAVPVPLPERDFYHGMILSPDARTAVMSGDNQHPSDLVLWDTATGQKRLTIHEGEAMRPPVGQFAPDGSLLLVPEPSGLSIYDPLTGERLHREPGHPGIVGRTAFSPSGRLLATANLDYTVLIWKTADILDAKRPKPATLSADALAAAWTDLADADGEKSYAALGKLARSPREAMPWLREHVRPIRPTAPLSADERKRLERLLADLDSDEFETRKQAAVDIEKFGASAVPFVDKVLAGKPSAEVRTRLEKLKEKHEREMMKDGLRPLRAVEVLEHIGTTEARQALGELAKGAPEARLTREAKAALERLARRAK